MCVSHSVTKCEYQVESVQLCLAYLSDAEYIKKKVMRKQLSYLFLQCMLELRDGTAPMLMLSAFSLTWRGWAEREREEERAKTRWQFDMGLMQCLQSVKYMRWQSERICRQIWTRLWIFFSLLLSIFSTLCYGILVLAMCTKSVAAVTANTHTKPRDDGSNEAWQNGNRTRMPKIC